MKLRYCADAPNYDAHEQIIDLLYTTSDTYGITVEIERVNNRHGSIQVFPGGILEHSPYIDARLLAIRAARELRPFRKRVNLPAYLDDQSARTDFNNGVLEVAFDRDTADIGFI